MQAYNERQRDRGTVRQKKEGEIKKVIENARKENDGKRKGHSVLKNKDVY